MSTNQPVRIGIVTVSDRASRGVYQDLGGPAIRDCLTEILSCPWEPVVRVIPDERPLIEETLKQLCDRENCCLVVTTGGTGPARRDVTPEATEAVCEKLLDGFGELMRAVSLKVVPTAILSRQTAGIRGCALIVNLPGKPSRHPRLPAGRLSGNSVLCGSHRGALSDHKRGAGEGISAEAISPLTLPSPPFGGGEGRVRGRVTSPRATTWFVINTAAA